MSDYKWGSDGIDDEETPEERRARHDRDAWRNSRGRHEDRARSVKLVRAVKARVFGGGLGRIEYDLLIVAFDDPRESAEAWRRYTSPYVTNDILRSADEARWEQVNIDIENIPAVHPSNGVRFGTNRWIYPCSRERELLDSLREHFAQRGSKMPDDSKRCEVCGTKTDMACADCAMSGKARYVCGQSPCRDAHETSAECNPPEPQTIRPRRFDA